MATSNNAQKKRRWWNQIGDVYAVTKRTYSWIGWAMLSLVLAAILLGGILAYATGGGAARIIMYLFTGLMFGLVLALFLLTQLSSSAMYSQIEGVTGSVGAVLRSIKRGWVVTEEPIAANRKQDLVWRLVGRPGIVLISEGPSSRVRDLLQEEQRKAARIAPKIPIHLIECGQAEGQVRLAKLMKTVNKLPKKLSKEDVPVLSQRMSSLQQKAMGIPKGVDPAKLKINRRMLRGK